MFSHQDRLEIFISIFILYLFPPPVWVKYLFPPCLVAIYFFHPFFLQKYLFPKNSKMGDHQLHATPIIYSCHTQSSFSQIFTHSPPKYFFHFRSSAFSAVSYTEKPAVCCGWDLGTQMTLGSTSLTSEFHTALIHLLMVTRFIHVSR